jgi:integrase
LSHHCRISELLKSKWQHAVLGKDTWLIPVEATKCHKDKRQNHHVFLSALSVEQFKRLQKETGHTPFYFPSKDCKNHIDTNTVTKRQYPSRTAVSP